MRIWGCPSEVRIYNLLKKKLDLRTLSGFFIGYIETLRVIDFIVHLI